MLFYYKLTGLNAVIVDRREPGHPARDDGVPGRDDDAAGHRRVHPDDRHGRRLQRADLRAHQGGAAAGKGVRAAVNAGFDRVWWTIVDTHVASLIAAAFLFQFGTGPIRGFATTLTIGLLSNVFTAVFVSRTVFELVLSRRRSARPQHLGRHHADF